MIAACRSPTGTAADQPPTLRPAQLVLARLSVGTRRWCYRECKLGDAAEHVALTEELRPIEVTGDDELARLTIAFNSMLVALDASQRRQRQLIADAIDTAEGPAKVEELVGTVERFLKT